MATSSDVPGLFDIAINGVPYRARADLHRRRFHDAIRQQADTSGRPGETSLNPQDLWRRTQSDFRHGAGQEWLDWNEDDVPTRYYTSDEGIDPFTTVRRTDNLYWFTATKTPDDVGTGEGSTTKYIRVNDYNVWKGSGANNHKTYHYTGSGTITEKDWTYDVADIASQGSKVWVAVNDGGSNGGVYRCNGNGTSDSLVNALIPDTIAFEKGRLLCSKGYALYNITDTSSSTAPSAFTAAAINDDWEWDCWGSGPGHIFVAGGDGSLFSIYKITIQPDGTALSGPTEAVRLPPFEQVKVMYYYLGLLVIGTTRGIRFATVGTDGSITYGPVIQPTDTANTACTFITGHDEFIYGVFDGAVYHFDLTAFVPGKDLVPAYAAWWISPTGVSSDNNVNGMSYDASDGWHVLTDNTLWSPFEPVTAGEYALTEVKITTSKITFGLDDPKQFLYVDVESDGECWLEVSIDGGAWVNLGQKSGGFKTYTITDEIADPSGKYIQLRFELKTDGDHVDSSGLRSYTVRAEPIVRRTEEVETVIDLYETVLTYADNEHHLDAWGLFEGLQALARAGTIVDYQEHEKSYKASVRNVQWGPQLKVSDDRKSWEGPCTVTLKIYEE